MRRIIAVLLTLTLVFCLAACGDSQKADAKKSGVKTESVEKISDKFAGKFRVGYGRADMTPEFPVPLAGYGNTSKRLSYGRLDNIYASCIAISDEDNNTVLIYSLDLIGLNDGVYNPSVKAVAKAVGVPEKNIYFNCSHTHSAPDTTQTSVGSQINYNSKLPGIFTKAAKAAMNSRVPAKLYYGEIETASLNFVRHYLAADGGTVTDNHDSRKDPNSPIIKHSTPNDPTLFIVKFDRDGDKDVVIANFRAHATMTGGSSATDVSADWVGAFRQEMEKNDDCYFSYLQGGAGNNNPTSRIESEKVYKTYDSHGAAMAKYATECIKNLTEVKTGTIKTYSKTLKLNINHSEDSKVANAKVVRQIFSAKGASEAAKVAKQYDMFSAYHAGGIITKAGLPATSNLEIFALSIGNDFALTFIPCEQFDTNSCQVMEKSPFKYTVALGYTNGRSGYLPSTIAYDYGCYECDSSRWAKGDAEIVVDELLTILKDLHK